MELVSGEMIASCITLQSNIPSLLTRQLLFHGFLFNNRERNRREAILRE